MGRWYFSEVCSTKHWSCVAALKAKYAEKQKGFYKLYTCAINSLPFNVLCFSFKISLS